MAPDSGFLPRVPLNTPPFRPRSASPSASTLTAATASLFVLASCERNDGDDIPNNPRIVATEPLSREIETFVGGHAKIVWTKESEDSKPDTFAVYDGLQLWGIDTRDNQGPRQIIPDTSNYGRPLITPSGNAIVFTHKGSSRKDGSKKRHFDPSVFRVDWDGRHLEKLADGYAVDVWRDPETSVEWVYVVDLEPTTRASTTSTRLERFKLLDPGERELIWDQSKISSENIQLSRDGNRASGLFPWPDAGVLKMDEKKREKIKVGCWPSLSPDNSYLLWVFDGAHKNLRMFETGGDEKWTVPLSDAPGIGGREVYHPRWSNHPRFFTMTGPYTGESIGQSDTGKVEVYLGRFDEDRRKVEKWLTVTGDQHGDSFPDLWVRYVEPEKALTSSNEEEEGSAAPPDPKPDPPKPSSRERDWPVTSLPLLFAWEDANTDNQAGTLDAGRPVSVQAREAARFGPFFDMRVDGGFFQADQASADAIASHLKHLDKAFTLEVLATPLDEDQDGIVIGNEQFQLKQRGTEWVFVAAHPRATKLWIGNARAGEPNHLVVTYDGSEYLVLHNGKVVNQGSKDVSDVEMLAGRRGLNFGSGWNGAIEAVSLTPGQLDESRIEANWSYLQKKLASRKSIPRIRLRGKLRKMTADRPLEALDTYQRALLGYLYEVEEVVEGIYEGDMVMVMHWTILDRNPVQGYPRKLGDSYDLILEPLDAHGQLISERQWNDLIEPIDPYYDVETPKP